MFRFCEKLVKVYSFHTFDSQLPPDVSGRRSQQNPGENKYEWKCALILRLLMAASQGDIQALEQAYLSGTDMDCADYDNR